MLGHIGRAIGAALELTALALFVISLAIWGDATGAALILARIGGAQ